MLLFELGAAGKPISGAASALSRLGSTLHSSDENADDSDTNSFKIVIFDTPSVPSPRLY